tara:strand:- start:1759 stop:2574 length:816 start_codon:yes stop_codon:yes gene_type:complete
MFNKQEYVNWLHGVSRHGKQNFPVENTETKSPTNSKEPIDLHEGGFWSGIDKMRKKVELGTSKIRRGAERAERSRFGTEIGGVAAGARKRSAGFYGTSPVDTGFGKPVGHDDEEVLARRDQQRAGTAPTGTSPGGTSPEGTTPPAAGAPPKRTFDDKKKDSKPYDLEKKDSKAIVVGQRKPRTAATRAAAQQSTGTAPKAKKKPTQTTGTATRVAGSNQSGSGNTTNPNIRDEMRKAWRQHGGREGMIKKFGDKRTAEFMRMFNKVNRKKT